MSDDALQARQQLGWRWHVQQSFYKLLTTTENEWTTWSDAVILAEHVAETLKQSGYEVVGTDDTRRRRNQNGVVS